MKREEVAASVASAEKEDADLKKRLNDTLAKKAKEVGPLPIPSTRDPYWSPNAPRSSTDAPQHERLRRCPPAFAHAVPPRGARTERRGAHV